MRAIIRSWKIMILRINENGIPEWVGAILGLVFAILVIGFLFAAAWMWSNHG